MVRLSSKAQGEGSGVLGELLRVPKPLDMFQLVESTGYAKIVQTPDKGRGLFARQDLPKDTHLFKMEPIVAATRLPASQLACGACYQCLRPLAHSKFLVHPDLASKYSKQDLDKHKQSVKDALRLESFDPQAFQDSEIAPDSALQIQLDSTGQQSGDPYEQTIFQLMIRAVSKDKKNPGFLNSLITSLFWQPLHLHQNDRNQYTLLREIHSTSKSFTEVHYTALKSALAYNAISIVPSTITVCLDSPKDDIEVSVTVDKETQVRAVAIYPISVVNHSCDPNVGFVSPVLSTKVSFMNFRPVASGEEFLVNYVDVDLPVQERRAHLKTSYGFDCNCPKCLRESKQQ